MIRTVVIAWLMFSATTAAALDAPTSAHAVGAVEDGDPRAETTLVADHAAVAPGESFRVGVLFELDPDWHVYGEEPGDAGLPTSIVWRADGGEIGATVWPPTQQFLDPSGTIETHAYTGRVLLWAPATVTAATGRVSVTVEVDYLVCQIKCIPGSATLARDVPIGTAAPADAEVLALFGEAPQPPETASIWQLLLLALLGGALLNIMPCVFPVLALKVFGFACGSGERSVAIKHAGAYTAGIQVSMLVLAGVVIAAKLAGEALGWGFQFQEPRYLVGLTVFVTVFALNLFGVFEIGVMPLPSRGLGDPSAARSFVDGCFAVVLATPCSAPFLGTAVGFALASSPAVIAAAFVAVGVGLAAPFVVASTIPAIGRRLPEPGPWMEHFERVLGFALLGTATWLTWVFGRVAGVDGVGGLLAVLVAVSLGAWVFGRAQYATPRARAAGIAFALAVTVGSLAALRPWTFVADAAVELGDWEPWDPARIAAEQQAGRIVFVDFTADWCLTCKVNERTALATDAVRARLDSDDVVAMKADWTRRDDAIRAALAQFGRAGVPMYLVYPRNGGDPVVLPELLTESMVLEALANY